MPPPKSMIVAGIMSGTSADGIDVALTRISPETTANSSHPKVKLLAHAAYPFTRSLRAAVLASMDAPSIATAELARLNWRLGIAYAEAVRATLRKHPCRLSLIGCHGQTIYHQAQALPYLGRSIACTWQIGEPALIAAELHVPVVSNFRPGDMAAGGEGAPLVPLLDYTLFSHAQRSRILQNIGGIANLTIIPAGASPAKILAFDTGPGNMVIDALAQRLYSRRYDRNGHLAARGRVLNRVLAAELRRPYFVRKPPKTSGREQFGTAYVEKFLELCRRAKGTPHDILATATALTAHSISQAYERWVQPLCRNQATDFILSGGGARNTTLVRMLRELLEPQGCTLSASDRAGIPIDAKEAVAFALLAWQTWHRRPGNLPSATGARRPAILGTISHV